MLLRSMDRKRVVIKALTMKAAAIEAILDKKVSGSARSKTMAFIDMPYNELLDRINKGEFKEWKRK